VDEMRSVLGNDAQALIEYWGATPEGNFEGANILHVGAVPAPDSERARILVRGKQRLLEARERRVRPGRDDKVLAAWNGLMLRAVATAARVFEEPDLRSAAIANGEFLFREMVRDGTRVFRTHTAGVSRIGGFLEDHASVALGGLALYELTFERRWLDRARALADAIVRRFWDEEAQAFFDTANDHERLVTRPRDVTDNAIPSGTSLTVELLLLLGDLLGDGDMTRRANYVLETIVEPMARYPLAFGNALSAADLAVHGASELAIVGEPGADDFNALAHAAATRYVPSLVIAGGAPDANGDVALLQNRGARDGRATAYWCRRYVCEEPVTDASHLIAQIDASRVQQ